MLFRAKCEANFKHFVDIILCFKAFLTKFWGEFWILSILFMFFRREAAGKNLNILFMFFRREAAEKMFK